MQISKNIRDDSAQAIAMSTNVFDLMIEQTIAPDDEIVAAAQAGSSAVFEELHSTYSRCLYQTIFSITRNPQNAEEALQPAAQLKHLAREQGEGRS